ncbi:hypothetical protein Aduo_001173 [Ancylostoma duodenale]
MSCVSGTHLHIGPRPHCPFHHCRAHPYSLLCMSFDSKRIPTSIHKPDPLGTLPLAPISVSDLRFDSRSTSRTRRNATDSVFACASVTDCTTPPATSSCSLSTRTTTRPTSSVRQKSVSSRMCRETPSSHGTTSAIATRTTMQGKRVPRVWLTLAILAAVAIPHVAAIGDLSLPFGLDTSLAKSRFSTYVSPQERAIQVFVMKNISEDTPIGTVLDTFKAHDPTLPTFNYTFRINRQSDPKRQFTIDQDGTLRVAQRLDREDISSYKLIIEAFDAAGNVGTQLVAVYLRDVNDNGPEPYTVPKYCVFPENTPVNQQGTCEIRCTDKDSPEYGPPFNMQLDQSKWKYGEFLSVTFDAHGDGGNGSMTIRPLVVFDREAANPGKILEIPLILTDRADRTNHASVHVIIGDEVCGNRRTYDISRENSDMSCTVPNDVMQSLDSLLPFYSYDVTIHHQLA